MRWTALMLSVLAALTVGLAGSAGSLAQTQSVPVTNGCTAGPLAVSGPSDTVSLTKGECYKGGHTILTIVRYGYTQSDDGGASCGSVTGKTGRSFTPRITGTYSVKAVFTVAPKYKSSGIRSKSSSATLKLGHTTLQCGKLDPESLPGFAQMCDYQFDPSTQSVCGAVTPAQGSTYSGPYPMWSSKPRPTGRTVYAPSLVSPSGRCSQKIQSPLSRHLAWMGQPVFSAYWECSDGLFIAPSVSLFYYAAGASSATCSFTNRNLILGGEYTQFTLPPDSAEWGGTLYVVWRMTIAAKGLTQAYLFADKTIPLGGTANACAELAQHTAG